MNSEKRVFFSLNHEADTALYQELLQWLHLNDVAINPWTSADFPDTSRDTGGRQQQTDLVDNVVNSDYVVVIVGDSPIDPESTDIQALNAAAWMKRPIIALNINQIKDIDREHFPELMSEQLVLHLPMEGQVFKHALESWKDEAFRVRTMGQTGPVHYSRDIYDLIERNYETAHPFTKHPDTPLADDEQRLSGWSQSAAA